MRRLLLMRHGEVHRRWQGCCYGAADIGLSPRGRAQSRSLVDQVVDLLGAAFLAPDGAEQIVLFSSGLCRAQYLAELFAHRLGCPVNVAPALQERHFGAWERRPWQQIYDATGDAMEGMFRAPESWSPPGGETTYQLRDRALAWFHALPDSGTVLAVTHGGPIAALLGTLRRRPVSDWPSLVPPYGALVELPENTV